MSQNNKTTGEVKVTVIKINDNIVSYNAQSLYPINFVGHWADKNGNKIEKIFFDSDVRFYFDFHLAYNAQVKIYLESVNSNINSQEELISPNTIDKIFSGSFGTTGNFIEIKLKKLNEYKALQEAGHKFDLCFELLDGFGRYSVQKEITKIKVLQKIIIVLDPGHGHTSGKTGTCAWKYSHEIEDEEGKVKKDKEGSNVLQTSTFNTIPDYVYANEAMCNKWKTKLLSADHTCANWNEREIVFEVAKLMKSELISAGYEVYMTRDESIIKTGSDNQEDLYKRNKFSNDKNANYFISIHVNGNPSGSSIWKRGAFFMYRPDENEEIVKKCKQLGIALLKYFKPYNKDNNDFIPVVTDATLQQKELAVLSSNKKVGNNAEYKSLIEIGTYTNPKDASILFSNKENTTVTIAKQLVKGLLEHINNNF